MRRTLPAVALALLLTLTSCATPETATPETPRPAPGGAPSASRQDPAQAERTLASLRKLDDLPLYEMTYVGAYDPTVGTDATRRRARSAARCSSRPAIRDGRCSPATSTGTPTRRWCCVPTRRTATRRSRWWTSPTSVSGPDPSGDRRLLDAPLLPFDGMNERGLAVGLAADDKATARPDPGKPTVGSVRILRLVLDRAATVDEAVAVFTRHNLDFAGGPPLHYLLADATGASAVVEFVDGELRVERGTGGWQALTNVPVVGVRRAAAPPGPPVRADRRRDGPRPAGCWTPPRRTGSSPACVRGTPAGRSRTACAPVRYGWSPRSAAASGATSCR